MGGDIVEKNVVDLSNLKLGTLVIGHVQRDAAYLRPLRLRVAKIVSETVYLIEDPCGMRGDPCKNFTFFVRDRTIKASTVGDPALQNGDRFIVQQYEHGSEEQVTPLMLEHCDTF